MGPDLRGTPIARCASHRETAGSGHCSHRLEESGIHWVCLVGGAVVLGISGDHKHMVLPLRRPRPCDPALATLRDSLGRHPCDPVDQGSTSHVHASGLRLPPTPASIGSMNSRTASVTASRSAQGSRSRAAIRAYGTRQVSSGPGSAAGWLVAHPSYRRSRCFLASALHYQARTITIATRRGRDPAIRAARRSISPDEGPVDTA